MTRQRVSSGAPWESRFGYSRAVRVGRQVFVAGTTAVGPDGVVIGRGDPHRQTLEALRIIERALADAGGTMEDVVRTRMFVTDISRAEEYGRAHGEFFGSARPAATMVEVPRLIDPDMMVEVEVDALLPPRRTGRASGARRWPPAESL
ncbi:MAG TPA: RidA family protein [Thermoplasmata archaeon]|nr:RidA family protein [Thermoplasmata archaeon]